jgi:SEC-C motif-containing protein
MRSRYSAYVLKLEDYLLATWHPSTRPSELDLAADDSKWLGLEVKRTQRRTTPRHRRIRRPLPHRRARPSHPLHELSRFVREDGRWFYVDGDHIPRGRLSVFDFS